MELRITINWPSQRDDELAYLLNRAAEDALAHKYEEAGTHVAGFGWYRITCDPHAQILRPGQTIAAVRAEILARARHNQNRTKEPCTKQPKRTFS